MTTPERGTGKSSEGTLLQQIDTIYVIFKTHLDIGFTDFARNVVDQYRNRFIPQALETARVLRERGGVE